MDYFHNYTQDDWRALCQRLQVPQQHVKTLMRSAYKALATEPGDAVGLPKRLSSYIAENFSGLPAKVGMWQRSRYDHSVKFMIELADGAKVESVLMPEEGRLTLCLSSQVGCAQACSFCHTGRMGLKRQLTTAEIVAQLLLVNRWIDAHPEWTKTVDHPRGSRVSNIVFMGMGEPLDNVEAVAKAIQIFTDSYAFQISLRRVSVSTAGHLDGLREMLRRFPRLPIALSLHATRSHERSRLMPINRRWPIDEVLTFLQQHFSQLNEQKVRFHLMIQYTVISGVNDGLVQAQEMVALLRDLPVKINLIPLNPIAPSRFDSPDPSRLEAFRDYLHQAGFRVMVRYSKGQDIDAACGQLVTKFESEAVGGAIH